MCPKQFFSQQNARKTTLKYSHTQISASTDRCYSLSCSSQNTLKAWDRLCPPLVLWQLTARSCFCSLGLGSPMAFLNKHHTQLSLSCNTDSAADSQPTPPDLFLLPRGFRHCRNDKPQQSTGLYTSWDPEQI